jgi:hypothetical protein
MGAGLCAEERFSGDAGDMEMALLQKCVFRCARLMDSQISFVGGSPMYATTRKAFICGGHARRRWFEMLGS